MPSCLVNQCVSKTGRKGQSGHIILHPFPKDVSRIKEWLQQTGQIFKDLNALAQKILDENKYRLCSCHFTLDSYVVNNHGRSLRAGAIPSVFPIVKEGECIIEESLKKDRARKRKRPFDIAALTILANERERITTEEEMLEDLQVTKIGFCSIGTQTDYTLSNSTLVFKENQTMGSDVLDGPFSPGFVYEKPEIISRIQKGRDLCHTADLQPVSMKEEHEYFSETDVSTRYWRVESSVYGKQELLQVQKS